MSDPSRASTSASALAAALCLALWLGAGAPAGGAAPAAAAGVVGPDGTALAAAGVAGAAGVAAAGHVAAGAGDAGATYVAGRLVVKLRGEGPRAVRGCLECARAEGRALRELTTDDSDSLDVLHARLGVRALRPFFRVRPRGLAARAGATPPDFSQVYVLELPPDVDVEAAAELYRRDPHCAYAQPDYWMQAQVAPDDPFFSSSGAWGQIERDLWGLERLRLEAAWDVSLGEGALVGVVDTGVDFDHPELAENVFVRPGEDLNRNGLVDPNDFNGLDDDGNGFIDDIRGFDFVSSVDRNGDGDFDDPEDVIDANPMDDNLHGTHVAGTIAAVGFNGFGILGAAPRAKVLAVKALDASGVGRLTDLARVLIYAAESGADVINNSWGCATRCPSQPLLEDAVRLARALGSVVVFSAGNQADDVAFFSPQNMAETIAVAASTPDDGVASFSNFGAAVDLAAPGAGSGEPPPEFAPSQNILSLRSGFGGGRGDPRLVVQERFLRLAGTSMAAAYVSGLAALVRARSPELDAEQVTEALRVTADDIGPPGRDVATGAGLPNAAAAVELEAVPDVRAELSEPPSGASLRQRVLRVPIVGTAAGADFRDYAIFFGRGSTPVEWIPLGAPRSAPVEDGLLAEWTVEGLPDGSYVLRLVVTSTDGLSFERIAALTLRNREGRQISQSDANSWGAELSGDLIAWWDSVAQFRAQVFLSDLATGRTLQTSQGTFFGKLPSLSGTTLVWSQVFEGTLDIAGCSYERATGTCPQRRITSTFQLEDNARVSGTRLIWVGETATGFSILSCEVDPETGACPPRRITFQPGDQLFPALDGNRVVWLQASQTTSDSEIQLCDLDPVSGACPVRSLSGGRVLPRDADVSGDRVVWADEAGAVLCEYDANAGACSTLLALSPSSPSSDPAISGDRIAWLGGPGSSELLFCQLDPIRGICPAQRIGVSTGRLFQPDVDRNRVAWSEAPVGGPVQVRLLALPTLAPIGNREVVEGERLRVPVSANDPSGGPIALAAEQSDGEPLEALGAEFEDFGDGSGLLSWEPASSQVGTHAVTIRATDVAGLEVYETILIEVRGINHPPVAVVQRVHVAHDGGPVELDACRSFDPDGDALEFRWEDAAGRVIARDCRFAAPAGGERPVQRLRLIVSDGELEDSARVVVIHPPRGKR
jgi:subtilisin family serine protease